MSTRTVRNLPDDVDRVLRLHAAEHGRSAEGEVRAMPAEAVKVPGTRRLGDVLAALGREVALTDIASVMKLERWGKYSALASTTGSCRGWADAGRPTINRLGV